MNNKGSVRENSLFRRLKVFSNKIGASYIYKLVSKILSFLGTIFLIFLVVIGSLMFYFNTKAKSYQNKGVNYVPPFGLYTIISGSMEPSIKVYDVVVSVSERDLSKVKVGDIITFISTWDVNYGKTITHRVVSVSKNVKGEYQFTTKGDNNEAPDGAVVNQSNFVGRVVMRLPQLGRLQFFLATKMGWFIVVLIPALGVIIYDVLKIFKLSVLKKEINNVSNVGELNPDGTLKNAPEPVYEMQPSEDISNVVANDTLNQVDVLNTQADVNSIPPAAPMIDNVVPPDIAPPSVEIPATQVPIPDVQPQIIETNQPTTISSPEVVESFEIDAELPMPASGETNPIEAGNIIEPVVTEVPQNTIENNTPINNSNIVQTNINQSTRAPLARRTEQSKEEEKPNIPHKVMDLEDMVNIQLPVMKANAAAGIPEEGPLSTRQ